MNLLLQVKHTLKSLGLSVDLYVVSDSTSPTLQKAYALKALPYKETLYELQRSRAVLDIPAAGQSGLTLRPLEAMFFQKKLITSNKDIKHYPFYSKQNIFILGEDAFDTLPKLLASPFDRSILPFLSEYTVSQWIKRFNS